jgi:hypothetical protein
MRGAVVLVVAAALTAGACGGTTDWNAAHKAKPLSAAQARAAAAAQRKAELPYVDALVAKFTSYSPNPADDRCFAAAVVHGISVQGFTSHGITPTGLRNPRTTLDDLPTPSVAQVGAIGAAMQRCPLDTLGHSLAVSLDSTDAATATCLARALGRPEAQRFLGLMLLGRHRINLAIAHTVVGLMASCVDLAAVFVSAAELPLDPSSRQCFTTALHGAEAELKDFLALLLSNADREQLQEAAGQLSVAINQCRPGAQTGFTVPPS